MIWQRVKKLWDLSATEEKKEQSSEQRWTEAAQIKQPLATVIPYKPRDPVKEIVGDETAI